MSEPHRPLLDHRLIIVTGKGGVGKTAISCALAEAACQQGKRVLLAETSGIEAVAGRFESNAAPLGYTGRELRPRLQALRVDPHEALADYIRLQVGLGVITDRILRTEMFRHLLEAAPGWRELIILGKIWHLEQKRDDRGQPAYDLIVVDAPATGHGLTFLDVPRVVQQAIQSGPLARHANWVETMVHDRERTLLLPVTLAEELPVSETAELVERARGEIDIAVDRIVVNRAPIAPAATGADLLRSIEGGGNFAFEALPDLTTLSEIADLAAHRASLARAQRSRVSMLCNLPVVDFPSVPGGFASTTGWAKWVAPILAEPVWPDGHPSTAAERAS